MSSRKSTKQRGIDELLERLNPGDTLITSELSRLGRSLGQIIQIVDELVKRKVIFIAVKENIKLNAKQDIQTKVMVAMFGLFAEIERDLISERTKQGLAVARKKGNIVAIYLFGSYAQGNAGLYSDADILVVLSRDKRRMMDRLDEFILEFSNGPVPVDVLVYTRAELDAALKEGNHFLAGAIEGIKLV